MLRIITEDTNRKMMYEVLNSHRLDYTMYPATGTWKQIREDTVVIDFVTATREQVEKVAQVIKWENKQEAVLVLEIPATATFI